MNAACKLTTRRSGAGCSATGRNSSRGCAGISSQPTNPGVLMKPMCGSRAAGAMCIGLLIPQAHHRLPPVSAPRCCGGQTVVSPGAQRSIASAAPRHQHRSGPPLRRGDSSRERGRHPARPLPPSAGPILEQYPGAGPSSDQTTGKGQTGVSRVSRGAADNPRIRGHAHDSEGAGEVGERLGCVAPDSVHQQAVRGGGMRPRYRNGFRHHFQSCNTSLKAAREPSGDRL